MGETSRGDNHHCNTPLIWALWQSGQTEASPQWKTHESLLGVCTLAFKQFYHKAATCNKKWKKWRGANTFWMHCTLCSQKQQWTVQCVREYFTDHYISLRLLPEKYSMSLMVLHSDSSNMQPVWDQHGILAHWKTNPLDVRMFSLRHTCWRNVILEKQWLTAVHPFISHLASSLSTIALVMRHDERYRSPHSTSDAVYGKINILFLSLHALLIWVNAIQFLTIEDERFIQKISNFIVRNMITDKGKLS